MSKFLFMLEFELAGLGRSCACHNNPCDFIYAAGLLCPDDIVSLSLLASFHNTGRGYKCDWRRKVGIYHFQL